MNLDYVVQLSRELLDEMIVVYLHDGVIKGRWTIINADAKVIGIKSHVSYGRWQTTTHIDIDSIEAIEITKAWNNGDICYTI